MPSPRLRPAIMVLVGAVLVLAVVAIPAGAGWSAPWIIAGETCGAVTLAGSWWLRRRRSWAMFPHAAFFLGLTALSTVAFLRQGDGGSSGGVGALVLVPVIAMAFLRLQRQMWFHMAAVALTLGLPIAIAGAPEYPVAGWRAIQVTTVVAVLCGEVTYRLLVRADDTAAEAAAARVRLDHAQHMAGLGSWTSERSGWTVTFSDEMYRLLGMVPGSAVDQHTVANRVHPDDLDRYLAHVAALSPGSPLDEVYRVTGDDGVTRSLMVRGHVFTDGGAECTEGTVLDVSRVTELEAELASTTDRLLRLLDSTSEQAFMVVGPDGRINAFNRGAERLTGWSAAEAVGRSPRTLVDPGYEQPDDDTLGMAPPPSGERRILARDGTERWVNLTVTAVTSHTGGADGWIGIATDVTATHRAVAELEASEARFRAAFEAAPVGMALVGASDDRSAGPILWTNPRLSEMTGVDADAIVGRTVPDLVVPADRGLVEQLLWEEGSAASFGADFTLWRSDSKRVVTRVRVSNPQVEEGHTIVQFADVTATLAAQESLAAAAAHERDAAEALRHADTLRSEFVAMVSHELRTPLTSIAGYVEMMGDGDGGVLPPEAERMLGAVERNTRRLRRLVDDLLTLSRLDESVEAAPVYETVALDKVVAEAIDSVQAMAEQAGVGLLEPPGPTGVVVRGDRHQLEQAVTNILSNAVKFSAPGGSVRVDSAAWAGGVKVTVEDSGIGIDTEDLPHLFERFFRSALSQKLEKPGSGLGLTITKSIIDCHGGDLSVTSTPGVGTTFRLWLPGCAGDAANRSVADDVLAGPVHG